MKFIASLIVVFLLSIMTVTASAHTFSQGDVTVSHPWSRPTPPGVPMGVGYMSITNKGDTAITFVGATTPKAERVTIHESEMKDGMMSMRPLPDGLSIPAGETVVLKPHSYHLMLEQLDGAVTKGENFPMTLEFDRAESMEIEMHTTPTDEGKDSRETNHQH